MFYKYFVIINDQVDLKTNNYTDAVSYVGQYGGVVVEVLEIDD